MRDAELERQRKILHEAFVAGWQAALAVKVTSPAVKAVIESCFELWLQEEVDERHVLGLPFKRRYDLPAPSGRRDAAHVNGRPREPVRPSASRPPARGEPVEVKPPGPADVPLQRQHNGAERAAESESSSART